MEPQAKKKLIIGSIIGVALLTGAFFGGRYLLGQMESRKGEGSGGAGTGGSGTGAGSGSGGGSGAGSSNDEKAKCQAILATAGRGNLTPERQVEINRCKRLLGSPVVGGIRGGATLVGSPIVGGVRGGAVLAGMGRGADGIANDFA